MSFLVAGESNISSGGLVEMKMPFCFRLACAFIMMQMAVWPTPAVGQQKPTAVVKSNDASDKGEQSVRAGLASGAQKDIWKLTEEVSEFDGKKTQVLYQVAAKKARNWLGSEKEVGIQFSCEGGGFSSILMFSGGFELSDFHQGTSWTNVRFRFQQADGMTAVTDAQWFTGKGYAAPLDGDSLVQAAFRSEFILIEFTPYGGTAFTVRFELRGLKTALSKLETCRGFLEAK